MTRSTSCGYKCRRVPMAVLLLFCYLFCQNAFTSTFVEKVYAKSGILGPFLSVWAALFLGIMMCYISFLMVNCKAPEHWVKIKNWEEFYQNLSQSDLPCQYAYFGPTASLRKYTHHIIIVSYEPIYPKDSKPGEKPTDAIIITKQYDASFFPRLWYYRPRLFCCCNKMKRCCFWGWVGAGQIQKKEYLASDLLKSRCVIFNVLDNGEMPPSPVEDRLRRLGQRSGEPFWDLMLNNCEHYANWVMTGEHYAVQVATGPFWELYFLNSFGRLLIGTMHNVVVTVFFRLSFIAVIVLSHIFSYPYAKDLYWALVFLTICYNSTYIMVDIAKITHLLKCFGQNPFWYTCYSDYTDNQTNAGLAYQSSSPDEALTIPLLKSYGSVKEPSGHVIVPTGGVWPHEGLKLKSRYSMPIIPSLFKSIYLFLFSTAGLVGGSYLARAPGISDWLPVVDCLPIGELIMATVAQLGVYLFWYPLMASSLDFFLWHKPRVFVSVIVYLYYGLSVLGLMVSVGQGTAKIHSYEQSLIAAGNFSCYTGTAMSSAMH